MSHCQPVKQSKCRVCVDSFASCTLRPPLRMNLPLSNRIVCSWCPTFQWPVSPSLRETLCVHVTAGVGDMAGNAQLLFQATALTVLIQLHVIIEINVSGAIKSSCNLFSKKICCFINDMLLLPLSL